MEQKTLGSLANALCTCGYTLPYGEYEGHVNRLESKDHEADCQYRPVAELAEQTAEIVKLTVELQQALSELLELSEATQARISWPGSQTRAEIIKARAVLAQAEGDKTN